MSGYDVRADDILSLFLTDLNYGRCIVAYSKVNANNNLIAIRNL